MAVVYQLSRQSAVVWPDENRRTVGVERNWILVHFQDVAKDNVRRRGASDQRRLIWNLRVTTAVKLTMNTPRPLLLLLLLLASSSLLAQSGAPAEARIEPVVEVRYEKRTVISIDGVDVVGTVSGPTATRLVSRKRVPFRSLVTLRPNFHDALSSSSTSPVVTP